MSVEKVPARSEGELQARVKGNHDNPVSGNHPGTVTLNTQWTTEYLPRGMGGTGEKLFSASVHAAQHEQNGWHQQGSCKFTEALQNPWTTLLKLWE